MKMSYFILYLTFIYFSHGETLPEVTEMRDLDYLDEKCSFIHDDKANVTYKIIDIDKGTMAATFHLPQLCNHTFYKVDLQRLVSNESCLENLKNWVKNSYRPYSPENCINESYLQDVSNKDGKVEFRYVFSGYYRLQIEPFINSSSQLPIYSDVEYIKTNFLMEKISNESFIVDPKYSYKKGSIEVNILNKLMFEIMIIKLAADLHSSSEDSCQNTAVDHSECKMNDSNSTCYSTNNVTMPDCKKVVDKKIRCTFFNVTPGNYCIMINVIDDRCDRTTEWISNQSCTWRNGIVANQGIPDVPMVNFNSVSAFALSLVIIITLIILFFIGVFIYLFKKRTSWISAPDEPFDEVIPMMRKKKVLLLYPRDCKQFMTVMKSFGTLLKKSHNIEVFDCYNDEDVFDGPLDWLQSKLRNPQFYVMVVTSHCAHLLQEAIMAGNWSSNYSLYKEPSFLDKIFIYGLKWAIEDISPDPFCKKFIVGFKGFSDERYMLSLPTKWRRYILPDRLERLLFDMNICCSPADNLKNTVEHLNMESDIRYLEKFKSENPRYLEGILADLEIH